MAVFKCPQCGQTTIGDARTGEQKTCPFCGAVAQVKETPVMPPPTAIQAAPAERRPPRAAAPPLLVEVVADVAPGTASKADKTDTDEAAAGTGRRSRRRKRKRKAPTSQVGELGEFLPGVLGYLIGMGIVLLIWFGLLLSALGGEHPGAGLIAFGVLVTLIGMFWLYYGALRDGVAPEGPGTFSGSGLVAMFAIGIVLVVKLAMVVLFGVIYAVTNPVLAWKPALVTLAGGLILTSGVVYLRLGL